MRYVPSVCRQVKVTLAPKTGKTDYSTAKAFQHINLASVLLEKVGKITGYLRDGPLVDLPIHPRQHALQAGKSTPISWAKAYKKMWNNMHWARSSASKVSLPTGGPVTLYV